MSDEKKGDFYKKVVDQAIDSILDKKHVLLPWTRIRILYGKIANSPRAAVEKGFTFSYIIARRLASTLILYYLHTTLKYLSEWNNIICSLFIVFPNSLRAN